MESVWLATHPSTPATDTFTDGAHADTIVAGAGLAGLATAVMLARSGHQVVVLEARSVGAVTTGRTTGKLSLLQGLTLSGILAHHSKDVARAYVEGNREGQALLVRLMDDHGVAYERRPAYTYATTDDGLKRLQAERDACGTAGLDVEWTEDTELPFPIRGALLLPNQVQLHPLAVLDMLRTQLAEHGGVLVEGVRVTAADSGSPVTVTTTQGRMTADRLVLATGTPILDRGAYFAKLTPLRSYVTTYRVPGPVPRGMYLSSDDPTRSLRTVEVDGGVQLVVGGNGHVTGRSASASEAVSGLVEWTGQHFPGAERTYAWSAQDYRSVNRVPFVGPMPRGGGNIYVATGFNKWGMTNAVAAAVNLAGQILGGSMPWAETLGHRITKPAGLVSAVGPNAAVAVEATRSWVQAEVGALPDEPPAEGTGVVGRGRHGRPEAMSTVDGHTCRISAVCTHAGGIVGWNDAEKSWDCPLHGSRFAADGTLLEGPAVTDLE
ncbi:Glycine/D-amino acid oxidase [Raineyella antarctica]|uniref:Glycine/D-amino acid oxidase n=1 Tax=Raineyella antarctica TaxID=1577474 RepID=A0A1G6HST0_9ACTN|nr:FAD-dependent oxidoreductase [Raineyella antarctica]SDB97339.1 Glycine/D-amino acid oxidase [Raineyella antarctica]